MYEKIKLLPLLDGPMLQENCGEDQNIDKDVGRLMRELRKNEDDIIHLKTIINEKIQFLNAY